MHQTVIGHQQWADVFERLQPGYTQTIAGSYLVTTGTHPDLGGIVAEEGYVDLMTLRHENPLDVEFGVEDDA
jgi:hypothetical protein